MGVARENQGKKGKEANDGGAASGLSTMPKAYKHLALLFFACLYIVYTAG
jgi:hypothetical protein